MESPAIIRRAMEVDVTGTRKETHTGRGSANLVQVTPTSNSLTHIIMRNFKHLDFRFQENEQSTIITTYGLLCDEKSNMFKVDAVAAIGNWFSALRLILIVFHCF